MRGLGRLIQDVGNQRSRVLTPALKDMKSNMNHGGRFSQKEMERLSFTGSNSEHKERIKKAMDDSLYSESPCMLNPSPASYFQFGAFHLHIRCLSNCLMAAMNIHLKDGLGEALGSDGAGVEGVPGS